VVVDRLRGELEVDYHDAGPGLAPADLVARAQGKQGLVTVLSDRIDRELLEAVPGLRVVANIAVGYDNIDVPAAAARGVIVTNTPDVLTGATADLAMGLILAVTRRIAEGDRLIRAGGWRGWTLDFMLGSEIGGKQLGVVGFGRIGRAVARRAVAFGMRIAYADREVVQSAEVVPTMGSGGAGAADPEGAAIAGAQRLSLDELLASSDVVSIHVPLSPQTHHLIDARALARMKRSAYLVNTARGAVVDEAALAWALRERLIAGAALDVFEREPEVHPDLVGLDNVVLVPHLGSATTETRTAMADLAARNVIEVLSGRPPLTPVVPAP
jgi:glyoxylate reductase